MKREPSARLPRAPRFAVPMSMLYRAAGDLGWCEGRTENVSRSGVLFRGEQLMEPNTSVDMVLMLPIEIAGDAAGTTMCRGRIVRAVAPASPVSIDARPALAAAILDREPVPRDPRRI